MILGRSRFEGLPLLLALISLTFTAQAHRLDEYLQATLVDIEINSITLQINLTPGVAVADAVLGLIDRDHNEEVSKDEADAYAEHVRSEISLGLDGQPQTSHVTATRFPPLTELRSGLGTIHLELSADLTSFNIGSHELKFENRHQPGLSVYLVNALMPESDRIQITQQIRNTIQSESRIQFTCAGRAPPATVTTPTPGHKLRVQDILGWLVLAVSIGAVAWPMLRQHSARAADSNRNNSSQD